MVWDELSQYFEQGPESGILVLQRPDAPAIRVKPVRSGLYFLELRAAQKAPHGTYKPTPFVKLVEIAHGERFGILYTRQMDPPRIFSLSKQTCQLPHFHMECLRLGRRLPNTAQLKTALLDYIDGVMIPRLLTKYGRGYLLASDLEQELQKYNDAIGSAVEQSIPPVGILRYVDGRARLLLPAKNP